MNSDRLDGKLLETWTEELTERVSLVYPGVLIKALAFLQQHFAIPAELEQRVVEQFRSRRSLLNRKEVTSFLRLRLEGQKKEWVRLAETILEELGAHLNELDLEELIAFQGSYRHVCELKNQKLPEIYEEAGDAVVRELRAVEKGTREAHIEDMQTLNGVLEAVFHSDCDRDFWKNHIEKQIEEILQPKQSAGPNKLELVSFYFNLSRITGFATSRVLLRLLKVIVGGPRNVQMAFLDLIKAHLGMYRGNPDIIGAVRSLAKQEDRELRVYAEAVAHLLR